MDRRTIIFIFGMTAIFFLMNQWFYHDKTTVNPEAINEPKTEITITGKGDPTLLTPQEKENLQILKLYRNLDLEGPYLYALRRDEVFFWTCR